MSLVTQITALAERVAVQFVTISSRLIPAGGSNGQVLTKLNETYVWTDAIPEAPMDGKVYGRKDGQWVALSDTTLAG